MSTAQSFSTNDLRSASVDYKRFHDAQKWKHGVAYGRGRTNADHGRPVKLTSRCVSPKPYKASTHAEKMLQKRVMLKEQHQFSDSSSSADEDVDHHSAAPTPGAETIYFSFDAKSGPSGGSQVLNAALAKAIDKFESSATDKMVKEEYDVLDGHGEVVATSSGKSRRGAKGRASATTEDAVAEDEDYEFV